MKLTPRDLWIAAVTNQDGNIRRAFDDEIKGHMVIEGTGPASFRVPGWLWVLAKEADVETYFGIPLVPHDSDEIRGGGELEKPEVHVGDPELKQVAVQKKVAVEETIRKLTQDREDEDTATQKLLWKLQGRRPLGPMEVEPPMRQQRYSAERDFRPFKDSEHGYG